MNLKEFLASAFNLPAKRNSPEKISGGSWTSTLLPPDRAGDQRVSYFLYAVKNQQDWEVTGTTTRTSIATGAGFNDTAILGKCCSPLEAALKLEELAERMNRNSDWKPAKDKSSYASYKKIIKKAGPYFSKPSPQTFW